MSNVGEVKEKVREALYRIIDVDLDAYLAIISGERVDITFPMYRCGTRTLARAGIVDINSKAVYDGNKTFAVFSPTEEWKKDAEILRNQKNV